MDSQLSCRSTHSKQKTVKKSNKQWNNSNNYKKKDQLTTSPLIENWNCKAVSLLHHMHCIALWFTCGIFVSNCMFANENSTLRTYHSKISTRNVTWNLSLLRKEFWSEFPLSNTQLIFLHVRVYVICGTFFFPLHSFNYMAS